VEEDEDTQTFRAIDTERHEAIRDEEVVAAPQPGPPGPPPPGAPPRALVEDVWPWLALLGILAIAGLLVWLFVFRGHHSAKRPVPAVVGMPQQAAISRLTRDGFSVKAIREPAKKPLGIVVSQAPGGGAQEAKGATVTLHVSNGHRVVTPPPAATTTQTTTAQTTTAAAPTVQVPDVTGQDMASAAGQIEAAGLVAETDPVEGAAGAPGSVVQESPSAGSQAQAGGTVTLGVAVGSSRPASTIPDVTGKTAAEARAALLQAKLTVRTTYKEGKAGVVLAESPTGSAPAYTQVTISVGK
jgi:serine/threonine-protein kinase